MTRLIVKNLPKKITEERFKSHFSKIGQLTDAKLKFTKDGKFRQFGFIGYKTEEDAKKAIDHFNNTFIDATKITVEECKPLNSEAKERPWSKYSAGSSSYNKINKKNDSKTETKEEKVGSKKLKKIEELLGNLKDDEQFKEFVAANKAITGKESIWKNDVDFNTTATATTKNDESNNNETEQKNEKSNGNSDKKESTDVKSLDEDEKDFENGRIFIRNLAYDCKEEDLEKLFSKYKPIVEVSLPIDNYSKKPKGFGYVTFMFPEHAIKAHNELDGTIFQGRMLHILPSKSKPDESNDANKETNKSDIKQKKEKDLKKNAQKGHNWNTLFINQNEIVNLMSAKYNVDKSDLLNVNTTKKSAAVRLAVGETQIVNDIRKFLIRNGVKLDAFSNADAPRSKTTILIKNLPFNTSESEIREMFSKYGEINRCIVPEYGIASLVEFKERQDARQGFMKLAYRKFKNVPLYLEWAPMDVFDGEEKIDDDSEENNNKNNEQTNDNKKANKNENQKEDAGGEESDRDEPAEAESTVFVKNLNFATNEDDLVKVFKKIAKCKAVIARKISTDKEMLSMGYGFIQYKKHSDAMEAIKQLQHHVLDGHKLELKLSNKQMNSNNSELSNQIDILKRKKSKKNVDLYGKTPKIMVRNIPFEAKTKEVEELFKVFGELKYVRLPKKVDGTHRGFGFVEFITINDAKRAFDALCHSTHLFGRRLVLEWTEVDQAQDVEVLRIKEAQLSGPPNKKLKKSKIIKDLDDGHISNDET